MQNLMDNVIKALKGDTRIFADGKLLKNKLTELALKLDREILACLLSDKKIKETFFTEAETKKDKLLVFDKDKFIGFVNNKQFLPDSFTSFKNRIGLMSGGEYLKENDEVVLAWPYKDCVLEGGQDKEDQKRNEIFYNEVLAPDEIDRLFEEKALTNFKRIDAKGEHKLDHFTDSDNLIIKGNNLLALHSLKKKFRGKVKLIYIDPPYNTSSAANTFAYNNSFNHSSWLTFMRNRMGVAKQLLAQNGILAIAIDHCELFYLGVMLDELFGRENRMGVIAVVHNPGGRQDDQFFPTAHENMLFYAKDISLATLNTLGQSDEKLSEFKFTDDYGRYKLRGFRRSGNNSLKEERPGLYYPIYYNPKQNKIALERSTIDYVEILPNDEQGIQRCWRWGKETLMEKEQKYILVKKTKTGYDIFTKERECDYVGEKAKTIWDKPHYSGQSGTHELKSVLGEKNFSYPKSPHLIIDVLKITTSDNDIILDFFGGSGTTAHAVLELNRADGGNRQFILCEQMHYVETVTKERVKQVIKNNGNGSFAYLELKEHNESFVSDIKKAETTKALLSIYEKMKKETFFRYEVDLSKFDSKDFAELPLKEQKQVLLECLDKNHLYVNYSEIDDTTYKVSSEDKKLNKEFYEF